MKYIVFLKTNLSQILFSFFFSLVLFLDTKLIFNGESIGPFTNVMWGIFSFIDILWFCFFFAATFILFKIFVKWYDKISVKKVNKKQIPIFWFSFFILLLAWLPYLLSWRNIL